MCVWNLVSDKQSTGCGCLRTGAEPRGKKITTRENVNNEVLYDSYLRQNTIGVVTSKRMRRNGHVARIESKTYTARCENLQQPLGTPTRRW
jgi:hypothetical protein